MMKILLINSIHLHPSDADKTLHEKILGSSYIIRIVAKHQWPTSWYLNVMHTVKPKSFSDGLVIPMHNSRPSCTSSGSAKILSSTCHFQYKLEESFVAVEEPDTGPIMRVCHIYSNIWIHLGYLSIWYLFI